MVRTAHREDAEAVVNIGAMKTNTRRHLAVPRRLPALLLALLVAGSLAAVAPAPTDAYTYVRVSSLRGPVQVDRIVISRVGISLPIRNGVIGARVYERVAYHYPGTSWPGGHSNTYLYGHARAGTFLKLKYVRPGDIVLLHLVTGSWVRYKVTSVRRVRWNDGRVTLLTSTERLTLQTCTSYYKTADKLVILAVPVA
jgi:LPXTG-site transpeptidase (sortase) family protein